MVRLIRASLVLIWVLTGLYFASQRKLASMKEKGEEILKKRPRQITHAKSVLVAGWGGNTSTSAVLRETLLRDLDTSDFSLAEVFVDEPMNAEFSYPSRPMMPYAGPVTLLIAVQFKSSSASDDEVVLLRRGQALLESLPAVKALLSSTAVYVVNRSVHTEYGEYDGLAKADWNPRRTRDWPRGTRSPFIAMLTCLVKPARFAHLSPMQWARDEWWPTQSPLSEMLQPRARYVRNVVLRASESAPPFGALVMELWPSKRHMDNPFYFFDANNPWELAVNIATMLQSVMHFTDLTTLQGSILSEYTLV